MGELSEIDEIKKDVSINLADLDSAMIEHPSMFIHYAMKTVQARKDFDKLKNTAEIRTAQLFTKHRLALIDGGQKATEAMVDAAIKVDLVYVKAQNEVIEAQAKWRMCEVTESAFVQRKDLILELARDRRKEQEGKLRVLSERASRESLLNNLNEHNANK